MNLCRNSLVIAILCLAILFRLPAEAQNQPLKADPNRQAFERDIRTVAFERSVESDAFLYMYALKLKKSDEQAFFAAMKTLGERGLTLKIRGCEKIRSAELCAMSVGVYLNVVGRAEIAWEYARIAKAFADKAPGVDAADAAAAYQWLAKFERKAGFIGKANELEKTAQSKLTLASASASPATKASPRAAIVSTGQPAPAPNSEESWARLAATIGTAQALRIAARDAIGPNALKPSGQFPDRGGEALMFLMHNLDTIYANPDLSEPSRAPVRQPRPAYTSIAGLCYSHSCSGYVGRGQAFARRATRRFERGGKAESG